MNLTISFNSDSNRSTKPPSLNTLSSTSAGNFVITDDGEKVAVGGDYDCLFCTDIASLNLLVFSVSLTLSSLKNDYNCSISN